MEETLLGMKVRFNEFIYDDIIIVNPETWQKMKAIAYASAFKKTSEVSVPYVYTHHGHRFGGLKEHSFGFESKRSSHLVCQRCGMSNVYLGSVGKWTPCRAQ